MAEVNNATLQARDRNGKGHNQSDGARKTTRMPETLEELEKLLQSETDRRVTQALKTANDNWQQKLKCIVKAEREEIQRLAGKNTEKYKKELLRKCKKDIEEKERALRYKELEIKAMNLLAKEKLPVEFKDFVMGRDEADTLRKINLLKKIWTEKLHEVVKMEVLSCASQKIRDEWRDFDDYAQKDS